MGEAHAESGKGTGHERGVRRNATQQASSSLVRYSREIALVYDIRFTWLSRENALDIERTRPPQNCVYPRRNLEAKNVRYIPIGEGMNGRISDEVEFSWLSWCAPCCTIPLDYPSVPNLVPPAVDFHMALLLIPFGGLSCCRLILSSKLREGFGREMAEMNITFSIWLFVVDPN